MAGARLLAPYFGTSNLVWANVIGLILLYLSLGYWLGGRWADRHPTAEALGGVVMVAAGTIAVLPFLSRPLFAAAADAFDRVSAGAYIASFFATMLTFAIPVTALGAVPPWAIRLAVERVEARLVSSPSLVESSRETRYGSGRRKYRMIHAEMESVAIARR